jgi:hypothetical protein
LAGELTGYERAAAQRGMRAGVGGWVGFEPVLMPAPARPERWYEGVVPAVVRDAVPKPKPQEDEAEGVAPPPAPVVVERGKAEPARTERECAGEWVDTWLWKSCREHERRPKREATGPKRESTGLKQEAAGPKREVTGLNQEATEPKRVVTEPKREVADGGSEGGNEGGSEGGSEGGEVDVWEWWWPA